MQHPLDPVPQSREFRVHRVDQERRVVGDDLESGAAGGLEAYLHQVLAAASLG
jgi:hypothetical protein